MTIEFDKDIVRNIERIYGAAIILNSKNDFDHVSKWLKIIKLECGELEYLLEQFCKEAEDGEIEA